MRNCSSMLFSCGLSVATLLFAPVSIAQERQQVQFEQGTSGATLKDEITGHAFKDFVLGAGAGQIMNVSLEGAAYFNVLPPGSDGDAIYIGSINGNTASVELPIKGDYVVRVYLMGNARDTAQTVSFTLHVGIL